MGGDGSGAPAGDAAGGTPPGARSTAAVQPPAANSALDDPQVGDRVLRRRRAPARRRGRRRRTPRPRTAYGSAVSNVSVSVAGATGGSPPAVTKIRVGRSGGMLNGISIEIRPSVAVDVHALVGLGPRRAGERRDPVLELEDAAGQDVDARAPGRRRIAARTPSGSAPNSIRDRFTRVAADVVQGAAAGIADVPDVGRVVVEVREPAVDRLQPSDPPRTRRARAPRPTTGGGGT